MSEGIDANFYALVDQCLTETFVELSGQRIGEPTLGVWCSTCNLPSGEIADVAVLAKRPGIESFECDPVVDLITIWGCRNCQSVFQLPDSPTLKDNRDA
jgi:hypothetical protein